MIARAISLMLLLTSVVSIACEGNRITESVQPQPDPPPPQVDPSVLTTLEVVPSTVTLDEGSTVQLEVTARDQRGLLIGGVSGITFSSSVPSVAVVSNSGIVRAVAAGIADISVTRTVAGVTLSAAMRATIRQPVPSADLVITADMHRGWQPAVAHLTAGGSVKWVTAGPQSWSGVPQRMLYLFDADYYAVVDSLDLSNGSATLKLLTPGAHPYCSAACWDPPDYGIIHVH